jgi:hypothetical protein
LVLDAQALSLLADDDPHMVARIEIARQDGFVPVISTVTIAECRRNGKAGKRLRWLRSRVKSVDVTEEVADLAVNLLEDTGLDGHECVVDALVVATAARGVAPARVASSDGSHVPRLCAAASMGRSARVDWLRV